MAELDGTEDYFDSLDVIARIDELQDEYLTDMGDHYAIDVGSMDDDEREEYQALIELCEQADIYIANRQHSELFVRDDYFEEYARELAEDIGAIASDIGWPLNRIDWEAATDDLKMDYTSFEFRGTTYWARR